MDYLIGYLPDNECNPLLSPQRWVNAASYALGASAVQKGVKALTAAAKLRRGLGGAGKGTGIHSPIVPGGGLAAHEAPGGHLPARHVGKTEAELLNRVSTGNVKTALSFTDRATAEIITSKAIDANQSKINI